MKKSLLVYEIDWLLEWVYKESDKLRNILTDQTVFESRCIRKLGNYLSKDQANIKNKRYLKRIIKEEASDVIARYKNENYQIFTEMITEDSQGNVVEYEPKDVLADVEGSIIAKEMTALLAQDDHRTEAILIGWLDGTTNTAEISRTLARSFGGNPKSHRIAIHRFKNICRKQIQRDFLTAI